MNRIQVNIATGERIIVPLTAEEQIDAEQRSTAEAALSPIYAIQSIEQSNPITHRALRELILALGELYPAAKATPFYIKAKAADDLIKIERAKL